jgi:hypothetical protein
VGELGWAQPVFDFSHVGGLQQKSLGPSAQLSPALETGEKNNSKIWITTYQWTTMRHQTRILAFGIPKKRNRSLQVRMA